jgi:DNA adenine methylase
MAYEGPLNYFGGKKAIAKEIICRFPRKASLYLEPFFGGGGIFFQVPKGLYKSIVVNDLNKSIVTFYRVLRDRTDELVQACHLTPYALAEQRACRDPAGDPHETDELEVARRVWVRCRQNFGFVQTPKVGWRRPTHETPLIGPVEVVLGELHAYAEMLRVVHFDCADALELIPTYANPDVMIYADPPYHEESRNGVGYQHEMPHETHVELQKVLVAAVEKGSKVLLSGYGGPVYDELYKSWRRVEFDRALKMNEWCEGSRTEVLWASYPASEEIGRDWERNRVVAKVSGKERALLNHLRAQGRVR